MSTTIVARSDTPAFTNPDTLRNIYIKLLSLAFADAIHDDIISSQNVNNTITNTLQCKIFNKAMPNVAGAKPDCPDPDVPNSGLHIDGQFKVHHNIEISVFHSLGIIQKELTLAHTLSSVTVTTCTSPFWTKSPFGRQVERTLDLRDNNVIKTYNNKIYHIRIVDWNIIGVDSSHSSVCGEILMRNLGMEDYDCVLHDAESVGIFKQFKKGPPSTKMLYYLMLPEFLADSATKKKWKKDKCLFSANGVQFRFAGKLESKYPCWRNDKRNTFFSDYFCEMKVTDWQNGIIQQVWNKSNADGSFGDKLGKTITNPNKENNKTLIASTITNTKDADEKALAYQRKRSGDQFQALAIKRLAEHEEFHLSTSIGGNVLVDIPGGYKARSLYPPGDPSEGNDVRRHTYLVTHDLTLCSYALHLGISVLFTHVVPPNKIKRIYSFRLISAIDNNN